MCERVTDPATPIKCRSPYVQVAPSKFTASSQFLKDTTFALLLIKPMASPDRYRWTTRKIFLDCNADAVRISQYDS